MSAIKQDHAIRDERSMSHALNLAPKAKVKPARSAIYRLSVRFYRFMTAVPQQF